MEIIAAYILIGLVICAAVALSGKKPDRGSEFSFAMLFDPVWPVLFLWPLWLAVVLIERSFPETPVPKTSAEIELMGQTGVVITELRPLGRIQIGAGHFDARSDGRIVGVGTMVRVVSRSMGEWVVEEVSGKERSL